MIESQPPRARAALAPLGLVLLGAAFGLIVGAGLASRPAPSGVPAAGKYAVRDSIERLGLLTSYRFDMIIAGRSLTDLSQATGAAVQFKGMLTRTPELNVDALIGTQLVEPSGDASVSSTGRLVIVGDVAWESGAGASASAQPIPSPSGYISSVKPYLPEGVVDLIIGPFAERFERVGEEARVGGDAIHYRANASGVEGYLQRLQLEGSCSADLWIAVAGGHLSGVEIRCVPAATPAPSGSAAGSGTSSEFRVQLEISAANDPSLKVSPPG